MKKIVFFLMLIASLVSCGQEEPVAAELGLDKTELTFGNGESETTVNLVATQPWTSSVNVQWLTLDPQSGDAAPSGMDVKMSAGANRNPRERVATVTFRSGDVSKTLVVTQAAADPEKEAEPWLDIETPELSFSSIAGEASISFKTNKPWTASVDKDWAVVTPAEGEAAELKSAEVKVIVNDNDMEQARTVVVTIKAGTLQKTVNVSQEAKKPDVDPDKTAVNLSEAATANAYIVTAPSTKYGFKANVKGNGIPREFEWTFDGQPMKMGYSNVAIAPASVKLLWYNAPKGASGYVTDCPIKEESLKYDPADGHVYFETPSKFVNGNVVIAAYDNAGEIVWSWNIWAIEGYDPEATSRKVGRYTVMDRNLGSFAGVETKSQSDVRLAAHAYGNFYQWGRKDPFPAPVDCQTTAMPQGLPTFTTVDALKKSAHGYNNVIFTGSYSDNAVCLGSQIATTFRVDQAVAVAEKNPHKWMFNGTAKGASPYMWAVGGHMNQPESQQTEWRYLWGCVDGVHSVKTIHDPCPPGWKVPTNEVWMELFAHPELSAGGRGAYCPDYDIYIPFGGQKKAGDSNITGVTNSIYLASATVTGPYYPTRGDLIWYNNEMVPTTGTSHYNSYGGQGLQVRCVKEDAPETAAPAGKQDGYDAVLMGDSITATWPTRGRAAFFTENNYNCAGISGHTTMDMVARFSKDVLKKNPKVVVITAGTNDLAENDGFHVSIDDIMNNIRLMAVAAEDYGAKIIIGSVCPSRDFSWKRSDAKYATDYSGDGIANKIIALNAMLKAWAESEGYGYADYHSALKDSQNNLKDEYCYVKNGELDRVHPGAAGFAVMEQVLKPLIDAALGK